MPKIKDLGVKVIPETMRPPEMGLGGGNCFNNTFNPCVNLTHCNGCTFVQCSGQLTITWKFTPIACIASHIWGTSPVCGGSMTTPFVNQGGDLTITREGVGLLKEELHRTLEVLEVYERTVGPQTAEAIDARLRELDGERTQLNQRRKDLDKK